MTKKENDINFRNESDNKFVDISSEKYREYKFLGKGVIKIADPLRLSVSPSGGHRVFDAHGKSHYIQSGWHQITWEVHPDAPNFVK